MECSAPGFPVHCLPEFTQTDVHSVGDADHLILCHPHLLLLSVFSSIRVFFTMSQLFASGGQSIGTLASVTVLPMDIWGCFPLAWTGWISLGILVACEVAQSYPTLCNPWTVAPPGSSIHGIFQARVLEWVAIYFSGGSSRPRDRTWVSCRRFTV